MNGWEKAVVNSGRLYGCLCGRDESAERSSPGLGLIPHVHLGGVSSTSHIAWVLHTPYTLVDRILMSIVVSLALHERALGV